MENHRIAKNGELTCKSCASRRNWKCDSVDTRNTEIFEHHTCNFHLDVLGFFDLKTQIFSEIDEFLNSSIRNKYIGNNTLTIYVRKSKRRIGDDLIEFFDIANVSVDEKFQGFHIFTSFLENFLHKYPSTNMFIECIHNPSVTHIAKKFGFKIKADNEFDINMYLIR